MLALSNENLPRKTQKSRKVRERKLREIERLKANSEFRVVRVFRSEIGMVAEWLSPPG
jgi:hypothetical protein